MLVAVVVALYAPTARFSFVNFDDPLYVLENPHVRAGLSWSGIAWAFTSAHAANWHPLTWLSHMLDWELFDAWGGGPHLANVGLHALNALLLLRLLDRLTGRFWPSAVVAALFAWHPARVESVAWISERKDVLSSAFWLLAAHAYVGYAARPTPTRMVPVAAAFVAGLLSKPMVVTQPLVFLLLDYWPLDRRREGWRRLVGEKIPLILLAAAAGIATLLAQHAGHAVVAIEQLPPGRRIENAVVSYVRYLTLLAWPTGLAIQYPYRIWPAAVVAGAAAVLVGFSLAAVVLRRRAPYLLVGGTWYVVMLAPTIGIVQVGSQALADRYTYLSCVGPLVAIVWGIDDLLARAPAARPIGAVAAAAATLALLPLTWRQVQTWRDNTTLFSNALAVAGPSAIVHTQLAMALSGDRHRDDEAMAHYGEALRLDPRHATAHVNLANLLSKQGRTDEALRHYRAAIEVDPGLAEAHNGLGLLLGDLGRRPEAIAEFEAALAARGDYPEAHSNLAGALQADHRYPEAIAHYAAAAALRPDWPDVPFGWGMSLLALGDPPGAVTRLEQALRVDPGFLPAALALAWVRATSPDPTVRDGAAAVALAERALQAIPAPAAVDLDTLAATYAEAGRFADAAATADAAIALARRAGDTDLAAALQARRELYAARKPYRTPAGATAP